MRLSQYFKKNKIYYHANPGQRKTAAIMLAVILAIFILFRLASAGVIDLGMFFYPCGFKQRWDLPCPTCGMTTSALAFFSGRILEAFYIQPAGGIFCSILVITAFFAFLTAVFGVYFSFLDRFFMRIHIKYVVLTLIIIVAIGWAVTLTRALHCS